MSDSSIEKTASLENLESFGLFAEGALRKLTIQERPLQELLMALDEAVANVALHAYGAEKGPLKITVSQGRGEVSVELEDYGKPFNPESRPIRDFNVPLEEREAGGMGVQLMRKLVDGLRYRRENGINHLTLIKRTGG